ncbi:hypothetical protein [Hymenobacter sp. YC55]|uniref:hypothetical protein n=1 Tax=Hymenobacter sp. YC55 TaxID=3034019 RepID=UPI0023F78D96|nr:hypothetical protein [Hymenobacter sp. YC55]MDF7810480.1 hypothetical protein [Hymenobacter sp. YC55]
MPWIQTFTGQDFDPFNPSPAKIKIEDIAHALANQCRFSGHTKQFYSVAQHCVEVASRVAPEYQGLALMHDASEAYLADLPRPLKAMDQFQFYRDAEKVLQATINHKFGLTPTVAAKLAIKTMDLQVLLMEVGLVMGPCNVPWNDASLALVDPAPRRVGWKPLSPGAAKRDFLNVFYLTVEAPQHKQERDQEDAWAA